MAATPLPAAARYYHVGTTTVYWLLAVANPQAAPTRLEINAGTDLSRVTGGGDSGDIAAMAGWTTTSANVGTPDIRSRFVGSVPGRITAEDSSITFYLDPAGQDVRTVLARDDTGFVLVCWGGDATGRLADLFPVRVSNIPKSFGDDQAVQTTVGFAITRAPTEDIALPAVV